MFSSLGSVAEYIAIFFLVALAGVGIWYQAKAFFGKERREKSGAQYQEFTTTVTLLQNKVNIQQEEINELKGKIKVLEDRNSSLLTDIALYSEKANHYLALFCTRCPYESLKEGKGYCDYFHPIDKKHIREHILSKVYMEEPEDDIEEWMTEKQPESEQESE